ACNRYSPYGGDSDSQTQMLFNIGTGYKVLPPWFCSTNIGISIYDNQDFNNQGYSKFEWKFKTEYRF
ncbi:MAG: hypothetical protein K8S56_02545, partial [Candidatus Cloacimonetes bacterium]|nr:hypothetical protein [Candidatus Cloacimonadota bacterium]